MRTQQYSQPQQDQLSSSDPIIYEDAYYSSQDSLYELPLEGDKKLMSNEYAKKSEVAPDDFITTCLRWICCSLCCLVQN